jgi:ribosome-binding protein aMBF1 (putative translation factor)
MAEHPSPSTTPRPKPKNSCTTVLPTASSEVGKWLAELRQTPEYSVEYLVLDFVSVCEVRRAELGLSYGDLARRMDVKRSRVIKLMRGDQKSSIELLVKLVLALWNVSDQKVSIRKG